MSILFDQKSTSGLIDEFRDHRDYVDILANFQVISGSFTFHGLTLSRSSFTVKGWDSTGQPIDFSLYEGNGNNKGQVPFTLRINLSGFVLEVELCAIVFPDSTLQNEIVRFQICTISEKNQIALNRVVRAFMAGMMPTIDDIVRSQDPETRLPKAENAPRESAQRWRSGFVSGLAALSFVVIIIYGLLSIYGSTRVIKAEYAVLTAPKIDLFSKVNGEISSINAPYQSTVSRDQLLFQMNSADIDADIQATLARIRFFEAIDDDPELKKVAISLSSNSGGTDNYGINQQRLAMGTYSQELERGLLASLELKKASLLNYSPCDCRVVWSIDEGASVRAGDRIMTLAKTAPGETKVEALVNSLHSAYIHPGQVAFVKIPGRDLTIKAIVERTSFDGDLPPRVGFSESLRINSRMVTVVLRADNFPGDIAIGSSLEVVIKK